MKERLFWKKVRKLGDYHMKIVNDGGDAFVGNVTGNVTGDVTGSISGGTVEGTIISPVIQPEGVAGTIFVSSDRLLYACVASGVFISISNT